MAGEFVELFEELLFGVDSGGIIVGFGVLLSLAFIVTWKVKYSGLPWAVTLILLGFEYFDRIAGSSNFMWFSIITWLCAVMLILKVALDDVRN